MQELPNQKTQKVRCEEREIERQSERGKLVESYGYGYVLN